MVFLAGAGVALKFGPVWALPLDAINESALSRAFALPVLGHAALLGPADEALTFSVDVSNEFVQSEHGHEALRLDGETDRWTLRYRRGAPDGFEWDVALPLLHVGGGFLDQPIEDWHDTFGFPDNHRSENPRKRFDYRYLVDGETRFAVTDGGTGLGDVEAGAGWALTPALALRGMLKLPTGDEDLLGGGDLGGAAWADWALPIPVGHGFDGYLSGGVSAQQRAEPQGLKHLQNRVVPFAGTGAGWQALPSLQALAQLYLHGPLFRHTDLPALERPGLQLVLGGRWCPRAGSSCVELSFTEDPVVGSSPDFSVRVAYSLHAPVRTERSSQ